jgi:hypothetical protein
MLWVKHENILYIYILSEQSQRDKLHRMCVWILHLKYTNFNSMPALHFKELGLDYKPSTTRGSRKREGAGFECLPQ